MTKASTDTLTDKKSILFLGDCNTLGTPDIEGNAYPECFTQGTPLAAINCGHTMTTTREGSEYFRDNFDASVEAVCIQYGLVDSWKTFKYSPYVLYYPDSRRRKIARKLVKKFKKWCKTLGLNSAFGEENVVPLSEYHERIAAIIQTAAPKPVILIETVPNKDLSRNAEIERFNAALNQLAIDYDQVYLLPLFADFLGPMREHYNDPTHLSETGHAYVAKKLRRLIHELNFDGVLALANTHKNNDETTIAIQ